MSPSFYHVIHVFSMAALVGYSFYAFALPAPETKKRVMMVTGIASLAMLIAGFGLISKMGYSFSAGWIWVKVACWIGLSMLPGMAYRRRERAGLFIVIALVLVLIAIAMVYFKPF
ncbi:hypothetical protein DB347_07940 [Opitutaceae bacterium EW11]|nr:hypothetical protein DB347_07940 [Opitutaceae bacterium EW11]